jgi:gliding motility-associated-like protein
MPKFVAAFILFLIACSSSELFAQSNWFRHGGSPGQEWLGDMIVHPQNGIAVCGSFNQSFTYGIQTLNPVGLNDAFLIFSDAGGAFLWAKRWGGPGDDRASAITSDVAGNIYVAGRFGGSVQFGSFLLNASGVSDIFIVKLNSLGQVLQAWRYGGTGQEEINDIAVSSSGQILVTGSFIGQASFGSNLLNSTVNVLTQQPTPDVFILSIQSNGNVNWVKQGKASFADRAFSVCFDLDGNCFASGQFSDTITFDQSYSNVAFNAMYLLKMDSTGQEIWMNKIVSSTTGSIKSIIADAGGNIWVGGDAGNNSLFSGPVNVQVLSGTYPNLVFAAKYLTNGAIDLLVNEGSENSLSGGYIFLPDTGGFYLAGQFKCAFSSMNDRYGQGRFISTGLDDPWVATYTSTGQLTEARQLGGQGTTITRSIAALSGGQMIWAGHYDYRLIVPSNPDFNVNPGQSNLLMSSTGIIVCGDSAYSQFLVSESAGQQDFAFGAIVDFKRQPYDFFTRKDTLCLFPQVSGCIGNGQDNQCAGDSLFSCGSILLSASTNTSGAMAGDTSKSPGPFFSYLWSNGDTTAVISVSNGGWYSVTAISRDACLSWTDSIYVVIYSQPGLPVLSDDKGINFQSANPSSIFLCAPDTVVFTAGNLNGNTFQWNINGSVSQDTTFLLPVLTAGSLSVNLIVSNLQGCQRQITCIVEADSALAPALPILFSSEDDTVSVCSGGIVNLWVSDSLVDPLGQDQCGFNSAQFSWSSVPSSNLIPVCNNGQQVALLALQSGSYDISVQVTRTSGCGGADTFLLSKTVFVQLQPPFIVNPGISTNDSASVLCTGETRVLTASGGYFYSWTGPGVPSPYNDSSVVVEQAGTYCVFVTDSSQDGCIGTGISCITFSAPQVPVLVSQSADNIICPGDSIGLQVSGSLNYQWYGPQGLLAFTSAIFYTSDPGFYYVYGTDSAGCTEVTNAIELSEYTTPVLIALPQAVICNGQAVEVQVISNANSSIQWLSPLQGSAGLQIVSAPGTYQCSVISCGITTIASITLSAQNFTAEIDPSGNFNLCEGDSLLLSGDSGMAVYEWLPLGANTQQVWISAAGSYSVFEVTPQGCRDTSDILVVSLLDSPDPPLISSPDSLCEEEPFALNASFSPAYSFSWLGPDGFFSTSAALSFSSAQSGQEGFWVAQVSDGICSSRDSVFIRIDEIPYLKIESAPPWCFGDSLRLSVSDSLNEVQWFFNGLIVGTGSVLSFERSDSSMSGLYQVRVLAGACQASDSLMIKLVECENEIPNVFSPNDDDINDVLNFDPSGVTYDYVRIFNRWGAIVYEGERLVWNGRSSSGEPLPAGTYFYVLSPAADSGQPRKGQLLLLR